MRVHEFAKAAGASNESVTSALNQIRGTADATHMSNITDDEQAVLVEKFPMNPPSSGPSSEGAAAEESSSSAPPPVVVTRKYSVSAFGLDGMEIDATDEGEAIRLFVLAKGIVDTAKYNFRAAPVSV